MSLKFRLFIVAVIIAAFPMLVAAQAAAYTTLGDLFADMARDAAHSIYGDKEDDLIEKHLGITVEYCDIRFPNRDGSVGTETHRRPGAFLCLKEYLGYVLNRPEKALDLTLYARTPNYPSLLPLKLTLKAPPMPVKKWTDYINPFSDYPKQVFERVKMWRDLDVTIESALGPLPLSVFFPEQESYQHVYQVLSQQDGEAKIYRLHLKAKTFLSHEVRSKPCLMLGQFDTHKSRVCFEAQIYSAPRSKPVLILLGVTNWNLRSDESRLLLEVNPENRIQIEASLPQTAPAGPPLPSPVESAPSRQPQSVRQNRCGVDQEGVDVVQLYADSATAQLRSMLQEKPKLGQSRKLLDEVLEEIPAFQLFNTNSILNMTYPQKSDIFVEGFFRAKLKRKDYLLIPALGIGLDLKESDIIYFCIEYTPEVADRRVTLLTLTPSLNQKNQSIEIKRRPVSLTLNPVSGAQGIIDSTIGRIPGVGSGIKGILVDGLLQLPAAFVDVAWMGVRRYTIHPRVYRVELTPNQIDINYQVRVLRILKLIDKRKTFKREVPLLQQKDFDEEAAEVIIQNEAQQD
jgi:hypothetical protein